MEFTRVQIMELDKPNLNGRVYPRGVVESALQRLNGKVLAVTHVNSFLKHEGAPPVADSLGVAKDLAIDDNINMLMADVKVERVPEDLRGGYVIRSAGFGKLEGNVVTEFTFSAVILGKE